MHQAIRALLDLHDVNRQRQILIKERRGREAKLAAAEQALRQASAAREQAEQERADMDALIRQYTADSERCERTIAELREKQMQAKTNKEYLTCINGIESARAEKRLRDESLKELKNRVDAQEQKIAQAKEAEAAKQAKMDEVRKALGGAGGGETSEAELDRIYNDKKREVDPKFLETYERLIGANHPMPMMKVDARTRATPMGNMINTQALEQLRLGHLVLDPATNAILYLDEE